MGWMDNELVLFEVYKFITGLSYIFTFCVLKAVVYCHVVCVSRDHGIRLSIAAVKEDLPKEVLRHFFAGTDQFFVEGLLRDVFQLTLRD